MCASFGQLSAVCVSRYSPPICAAVSVLEGANSSCRLSSDSISQCASTAAAHCARAPSRTTTRERMRCASASPKQPAKRASAVRS